MAIAEKQHELETADWKVSGKALELLQCFMSGLDDVVMRLALSKARERGESAGDVRVEARDIEEAADAVLKNILSQESIPPQLKEELARMDACLRDKCRNLR